MEHAELVASYLRDDTTSRPPSRKQKGTSGRSSDPQHRSKDTRDRSDRKQDRPDRKQNRVRLGPDPRTIAHLAAEKQQAVAASEMSAATEEQQMAAAPAGLSLAADRLSNPLLPPVLRCCERNHKRKKVGKM